MFPIGVPIDVLIFAAAGVFATHTQGLPLQSAAAHAYAPAPLFEFDPDFVYRDDFEFHDGAAPSHLAEDGSRQSAVVSEPAVESAGAVDESLPTEGSRLPTGPVWSLEAEKELKKIPFFVRGKAKRNTESFAVAHSLPEISLATLYDAKAHYGR